MVKWAQVGQGMGLDLGPLAPPASTPTTAGKASEGGGSGEPCAHTCPDGRWPALSYSAWEAYHDGYEVRKWRGGGHGDYEVW